MRKLVLMLIISLIFTLTSCNTNSATKVSGEDATVYGNSSGNISNEGYVCEYNGIVFYNEFLSNDEIYFYRMALDGNEKELLNHDFAQYINVVNDWIYYVNVSDELKLYRIRTDGSEKEKLGNDIAFYLTVTDNWIFYRNNSDDDSLYRVSLNGTKREKISSDKVDSLIVSNDWIYYVNASDELKLYRIRTDGSEKEKLNDISSTDLNISDGRIFYCGGNRREIHRMELDGSNDVQLTDYRCMGLNVSDGWIYFANGENGYSIFRMNLDGKKNEQINDNKSEGLCITGEWIYYEDKNDKHIYRIKTDGTGKEKLSSIKIASSDSGSTNEIIPDTLFFSLNDNGEDLSEPVLGDFITLLDTIFVDYEEYYADLEHGQIWGEGKDGNAYNLNMIFTLDVSDGNYDDVSVLGIEIESIVMSEELYTEGDSLTGKEMVKWFYNHYGN